MESPREVARLRPHVIGRAHHGLHLLARRVAGAEAGRPRGGLHVLLFSDARRLQLLVLAEAEVEQMDMTFDVEDDVVRLDVAVDVVQVRVDVINSLRQAKGSQKGIASTNSAT